MTSAFNLFKMYISFKDSGFLALLFVVATVALSCLTVLSSLRCLMAGENDDCSFEALSSRPMHWFSSSNSSYSLFIFLKVNDAADVDDVAEVRAAADAGYSFISSSISNVMWPFASVTTRSPKHRIFSFSAFNLAVACSARLAFSLTEPL